MAITVSGVRSYAKACTDILVLCQVLAQDGYQDMVVPSRGAEPLARLADLEAYRSGKHREAWSFRSDWNERKLHQSNPLSNQLFLPFTADIPPEVTGFESASIRRFWVQVLRAIAMGDTSDVYLRFFDYFRQEVCAPKGSHHPELRLKTGKFVFLDTVVSGRAVSEIANAFSLAGISDFHMILVADRNGTGIKPVYRRVIDDLVQRGQATLLLVEDLFTEDKGPSTSGIWCVTMPELMREARDRIAEFSSSGAVGAGMYYQEVSKRPDNSNVAMTVSIAHIHHLISLGIDGANDGSIQWLIDEHVVHVRSNRLAEPASTVAIAEPRLLKSLAVRHTLSSSSTHSLRAGISDEDARAIVGSFKA